ncbi:MAG: HAD hydrolase-like protein [Candidatus Heimdallarchaeota archaeon]|nr:HAD hydrolase-like protein [Candidatus Heimdallarchaeota archaeon]
MRDNNSVAGLSQRSIPIDQAHLLFDLHGVLISKSEQSRQYNAFLVDFITANFDLSRDSTRKAIQKANEEWYGFGEIAKNLPPDRILEVYEERNAQWTHNCFQGKFRGDNTRMAEFLEYFIPANFCSLYPEVRDTLQELHELGIKMSLASSAFTRHIYGVLAGCNLFGFFEKIIGLDTTKYLKSNIGYFQKALEIISTPAEHCIFVGNSVNEIKFPRALGCRVITVTRDQLSNEPFSEHDSQPITTQITEKADLVLPDLSNLKDQLFQHKLLLL